MEWLSLPSVREALHVHPDSNFFDGDNGVGFNYTMNTETLLPFYRDVAEGRYGLRHKDDDEDDNNDGGDLRVLVYNGDSDPSVNSLQAENWTSHVGVRETEAWRPWTLDGCRRMGGYVTRYRGKFDFLTVRGSG